VCPRAPAPRGPACTAFRPMGRFTHAAHAKVLTTATDTAGWNDAPMAASRTEQAIAQLARSQHGAVSRRQLLAAGLSDGMVNRRLAARRLERLHPGVYAVGGSAPTWEREAMAACLLLGPRATLSHTSAGRIWGIVPEASGPLEVLVPTCEHRGGRRRGIVVHRTRSLTSADRAIVRELPVTTVGRTLVDLSSLGDRELLARALDDALCRRIATPGRLVATFDRVRLQGRRHAAVLLELLETWVDGEGVDSVAEGAFLRRIRDAGLPAPVTRLKVFDAGLFVARLDLAWPDRKLALEVDGFRWHANPRAFAADAERANRLVALGWTVLRATPAQLDTRSETVLNAVRAHIPERERMSAVVG
jgi:hypothetical protein